MNTRTLTSTTGLRAGDRFANGNDGRTVATVERNPNNWGAALIRFTDGSHLHAGTRDAWSIWRDA